MNGYVLTFGYIWIVVTVSLCCLVKRFDSVPLFEGLLSVGGTFGLWVPLTYAFFVMFYHNVLKSGKKDSKDDKK